MAILEGMCTLFCAPKSGIFMGITSCVLSRAIEHCRELSKINCFLYVENKYGYVIACVHACVRARVRMCVCVCVCARDFVRYFIIIRAT